MNSFLVTFALVTHKFRGNCLNLFVQMTESFQCRYVKNNIDWKLVFDCKLEVCLSCENSTDQKRENQNI